MGEKNIFAFLPSGSLSFFVLFQVSPGAKGLFVVFGPRRAGQDQGANLIIFFSFGKDVLDIEIQLFDNGIHSIAFPETGLGTFVGGGVTSHLGKLIGRQKAKELVFTGRVLDGRSAVEIGLALKSVPIDELMPAALEMAAIMAKKAPISMKFAKTILSQSESLDLQTALMIEAEAILACMTTEDWREGIVAFAEKRTPKYYGR